MAVIFDGKAFAAEKEATLQIRVLGLKTRGVYPKLASILVGSDPASQLYVNLKKKAGERIGAEVDIYLIKENSKLEDLELLIKTLNEDESVHGVMIQMPIPGTLGDQKEKIIASIDPEKDVDGLRADSMFLHPTSKAVVEILKESEKVLDRKMDTVCVVGAFGMVGAPLVKELKTEGYKVSECGSKTGDITPKTLEADVVVSTTGVPGLIKYEMVKSEAVIIDVGSPKGDVDAPGVFKKVSLITPVPGGVGPVTITCLLENLLSAC